LVKIYTRTVKKRYLNQKRVYTHKYVAIPIPSRLHELLQPFFGKDLSINIDARPDTLTIILTSKREPSKTFLRDENHTTKTQEKPAESQEYDGEIEDLLKYPPEETFSD
jgi:hypothetical protein